MARCKYGKLKNPVGGRRCKLGGVKRAHRRMGARKRLARRRRSRGMKVRAPFIIAGLAALGLLAYTKSQEGGV